MTLYWTLQDVLTAVFCGVSFALALLRLRPRVDPRLITFVVGLVGVIWYVPLIAQRALAPVAPVGSAERTFSAFVVYIAVFLPAVGLTLYRRTRR
jgi:hypothetical protein